MRLLFVADAQSPNTAAFLEPLAAAGHEVHLLSLHATDSPPQGVEVHFLSRQRLLPKGLYLTRWPQVSRWVRRIRPDLLVAYRVTGNGLLAAMARWRPLVVVPTGTDVLGLERRSPALRQTVRYVLRRADGILCWGPHMARAALALRGTRGIVASSSPWNAELPGLPTEEQPGSEDPDRAARLLIQPRGVDRASFAPRPYPPESERREVRLVTTRSLKRPYGHELMIRALIHLKGLRPRIRLVLAGAGPDGARLWHLASDLGVLDQVDFLGAVDRCEIPKILAEGSLYVSLIDHDGVSASLLEAMAVGLYPVVGDSEAARMWIRQRWNGTLLATRRAEEVAAEIRRLVLRPEERGEAVRRNWSLVEERADRAKNMARILEWLGHLAQRHRFHRERGRRIA
jgi:glycosyltransferase involved in cell wall biosynthesis